MYRIVALLLLISFTAWGANPAFTDFDVSQFGTNGNKIRLIDGVIVTNPVIGSGTLSGQISLGAVTNAAGVRVAYLDDVVAGSATNAIYSQAGTNIVIVTNSPTLITINSKESQTNAYITNIYNNTFNGKITITSNLYATNIVTTNLYSSNIFTTNLFAGNVYTTNLYVTNLFSTNAYITNLFNNTAYISNAFVTNLFATNAYITNLFATTQVTSNAYISNIYVTNITVSGNATNLNLNASQFVATDANKALVSTLNGSTLTNLKATALSGTLASGVVTNSSGSRVAYLSDTGTVTATNVNDVYSYVLSNAVAIGANGVLLDRTFIPPATSAGHIAIGFGTTNAEIRPAKSITGNSVSFDRVLTFAHAVGDRVVWFSGDSVDLAWWGAVPSSSVDVAWPLIQALYESGQESLWLDGSSQSYYTTIPMVASRGGSIRSIQVNAKNGYLGNGAYTNAYMLWNSQGARSPFTASAATDTITTPADWDPPANATNSIVIFYGLNATNLPTPLSNGVPYFVHAYSSTTMMVGLSTNVSEIINISADGTGFVYTEVGGLDRMYLHDVYLHGQSQANLNGIWAAMQQPAYWNGFVRCDNFGGTAFKITGQDMVVERLQTLNCGVGLDTRGWLGGNGMQFFQARYINTEQWTNFWLLGGAYNYVESVHLETPLADTGAAVDGSLEAGQLFVKNFYASQGSHTNTIFKMGTSGGFCSDYNIEQGYINVANDSIALLLNDQYKHRQIYANNSTNGAIRQFLQLQSIPPPTSVGISDMWSGKSLIGLNGRFSHFGMTYGPMVRLGAGTNDSTDLFQTLRSDGSTNSGFNANGDFYTKTNAAVGYALTSDSNGIGTWAPVNQVATNTNPVVPDFSKPVNYFSTNAAFLFLTPAGVDTTKTMYQVTDVFVTNSTAAAVLVTFPGTITVTGTAYVTNLSAFHFRQYAQLWTNCACEPIK